VAALSINNNYILNESIKQFEPCSKNNHLTKEHSECKKQILSRLNKSLNKHQTNKH